MGIDGSRAFLPEKDCAVCRAKDLKLPVPHRAHDKRCSHNRSTRGGSERSVAVEKIAAENIGVSVTTMLALQAVGASAGNGVCLNNIIAACAVVGLIVGEGKILAKTFKFVFAIQQSLPRPVRDSG